MVFFFVTEELKSSLYRQISSPDVGSRVKRRLSQGQDQCMIHWKMYQGTLREIFKFKTALVLTTVATSKSNGEKRQSKINEPKNLKSSLKYNIIGL